MIDKHTARIKNDLGVGYDAVKILNLAVGLIGLIAVVASLFGLLVDRTRGASFVLLLQGGLLIGGSYVGAILGRAILISRDILILRRNLDNEGPSAST